MTVDLERVPKRDRRGPSPAVTVLGAVTIAAYGVAYYSYGALIDPIQLTPGGHRQPSAPSSAPYW